MIAILVPGITFFFVGCGNSSRKRDALFSSHDGALQKQAQKRTVLRVRPTPTRFTDMLNSPPPPRYPKARILDDCLILSTY